MREHFPEKNVTAKMRNVNNNFWRTMGKVLRYFTTLVLLFIFVSRSESTSSWPLFTESTN